MKVTPNQFEIEQHIRELNQMMGEVWETYVFSGEWWILLILSILPWIIWYKIVDRKRLTEILLYGFFVIIIVTFFDVFGWNNTGWFYPETLLPLCTPLFPIDYTLLPILYMLLFQYFTKWKSFVIAAFILSAVFTFILEPLSQWLNIYKELNWEAIYSFPIYIIVGLAVKWAVEKIIRIQKSVS